MPVQSAVRVAARFECLYVHFVRALAEMKHKKFEGWERLPRLSAREMFDLARMAR